MAYSLVGASTQRLSAPFVPSQPVPMTMACWFNTSGPGTLISVGAASGSIRNQMTALLNPSRVIRLSAQGATTIGLADTTATYTSAEWNHAAGVFLSSTSRTPYLNGTAGPTNTTSIGAQTGMNDLQLGTRYAPGFGLYLTGTIAEAGVWSVELSAAEIASLAKGLSPRLVRPQSLVFYAPLIRDLVDVRGGLAITNNNGATVANHPRVYA